MKMLIFVATLFLTLPTYANNQTPLFYNLELNLLVDENVYDQSALGANPPYQALAAQSESDFPVLNVDIDAIKDSVLDRCRPGKGRISHSAISYGFKPGYTKVYIKAMCLDLTDDFELIDDGLEVVVEAD